VVKWEKTSYLFLIVVVSLIGYTLLKELPRVEPTEKTAVKICLSPLVVVYLVLMFLEGILFQPVLTLLSSFINQQGIGRTTVAGILLCFSTVGGDISGLIYERILKSGNT